MKLDAMKDTLASKGTKAFLVIRNDKIVYEWYSQKHGPKKRHYSASLAKAIVGGTSLMLALNDGHISVDDPACKYIPQWQNDKEKSKITIRHLATHSSGIENAEVSGSNLGHMELPGWKGEFWRKDPDPFSISIKKAPVIFSPGTDFQYSNPGMAILAYVVTASLKKAPQSDILTLLQDRIMRPIGVPDEEWSIGYNKTCYTVDGLNLYANWGGGEFTARAAARVGRLMLNKGNWEGRKLVDSEWIEECVKYAGTPIPKRTADNPSPVSGLCWWSNFDGVWPKVPRDAYAGAGAGNQILLVIPSLNIIVVRNGSQIGDTFWGGVEKYLFNPLMDA
ncbi:serine hydrolase, partial [bacterium]|nr:serine hydrolase [bacterium]